MTRTFFLVSVLGLLSTGCDRSGAVEPSPTPKAAAAAEPTSVDDSSFRMPGAERIVAIGDVHGDLSATRTALRLAGAIDDKNAWIGGKLVVVQTGDQLDRGDDEPEILSLFEELEKKAKAAGGRFYAMNGNHEVMNVAGDFRYVTEGGLKDYDGVESKNPSTKQQVLSLEPKVRGRAAAFLPGGPQAKRLATRPVVLVVGDTAFAHGGILPGHLRYGLAKLNAETQSWMRGDTAKAPAFLETPNSPIWSRDYSEGEPSARSCTALMRALSLLQAKRMVVGHTVQKDGITSGCDGKVWRVDVGMAKHYGGSPQVLEIKGASVRAVSKLEDAVGTGAPPSSAAGPVLVAPKRYGLSNANAAAPP